MQITQTSLSGPSTVLGEQRGHLFLVADGMGGHEGGEEASRLAVTSIEEFTVNALKWFSNEMSPRPRTPRQSSKKLLKKPTASSSTRRITTPRSAAWVPR